MSEDWVRMATNGEQLRVKNTGFGRKWRNAEKIFERRFLGAFHKIAKSRY